MKNASKKAALDDEHDDEPVRQRVIPARGQSRPQTTAAPSVFALAKASKPKRERIPFDQSAVVVKTGVPLPEKKFAGSSYAALWQRMTPGSMVELPARTAASLIAYVKKQAAGRVAVRNLGQGVSGVWRLE